MESTLRVAVEHGIYSGKVDCPKNLSIVYLSALKIFENQIIRNNYQLAHIWMCQTFQIRCYLYNN